VVIEERRATSRSAEYRMASGEAPGAFHARALWWLLDEHPRTGEATDGGTSRVVLEIAVTDLPGGRVGHAYAIDDGPLGAPGADEARGLLWRWIAHALAGGATPPA
jgi:hypothetical protein